jgi:hypothetical protein
MGFGGGSTGCEVAEDSRDCDAGEGLASCSSTSQWWVMSDAAGMDIQISAAGVPRRGGGWRCGV